MPHKVGIDLVELTRFQLALSRTPKIISKIFADEEISEGKKLESLAAKFAAKEAFIKSLGLSIFSVSLNQILITKPDGTVPCLVLSGIAKNLIKEYSISNISLSLTHHGNYAAAVVLIEVEQ